MGFEQMEDDSREFMRNRRDCREAANREKDLKILFYLKMLCLKMLCRATLIMSPCGLVKNVP